MITLLQRGGSRQQIEALEDEAQLGRADQGPLIRRDWLISWPSSQYSPELGRSSNPRMFMSVVLPDPEPPSAHDFAAVDRERDALEHRDVDLAQR